MRVDRGKYRILELRRELASCQSPGVPGTVTFVGVRPTIGHTPKCRVETTTALRACRCSLPGAGAIAARIKDNRQQAIWLRQVSHHSDLDFRLPSRCFALPADGEQDRLPRDVAIWLVSVLPTHEHPVVYVTASQCLRNSAQIIFPHKDTLAFRRQRHHCRPFPNVYSRPATFGSPSAASPRSL
jgi:hypothetical protein